jgi:hypothetical protein
MLSEDNSALDTPELIECITEGLGIRLRVVCATRAAVIRT